MTRNPFLMFQTLIHNFCFWGFIRVPKVFLSDEKIVGLSLISLTFSFSASLRWNLMIASSEEDKWWSFPKCALDLEDFPNLTRTWRICIWLGGYLWTTVAPSCGLLWSCQGTEPVKRLWIMSIISKHLNETRVCDTFFASFPTRAFFGAKCTGGLETHHCEWSNEANDHLVELAGVGGGVSAKRGRLQAAEDFNNQSWESK